MKSREDTHLNTFFFSPCPLLHRRNSSFPFVNKSHCSLLQPSRLLILPHIELDRSQHDPIKGNAVVRCKPDECVDQLLIDRRLANRLRRGGFFRRLSLSAGSSFLVFPAKKVHEPSYITALYRFFNIPRHLF